MGKIEKVPPKIQMLPGENERDRVLTDNEEARYLAAAEEVGASIEEAYRRALTGIRARYSFHRSPNSLGLRVNIAFGGRRAGWA